MSASSSPRSNHRTVIFEMPAQTASLPVLALRTSVLEAPLPFDAELIQRAAAREKKMKDGETNGETKRAEELVKAAAVAREKQRLSALNSSFMDKVKAAGEARERQRSSGQDADEDDGDDRRVRRRGLHSARTCHRRQRSPT